MRVAGIGFRQDAPEAALRAALDAAGGPVDAIATAADKADAPAFRSLAESLGLPAFSIPLPALVAAPAAPSPHAPARYGGHSLAEAAALAALGPGARLLAPRVAAPGGQATAAIAEGSARMIVHFIGAGPGAPDLLTLRGRDLIAASPVCLYAGSLVPAAILAHCPPGARIVNTAPLSLDEIMAEIATAHDAGQDVARLHSGDVSVWSAMGEQLRRLRAMGIAYDVTPGVPSFAAAAAALGAELTLPGLAQSVVLTRTPGRASAMPPGETLAAFGATGATLAIHLSIHLIEKVVADLAPHYGEGCPAAVVWRASWPDQRIVRATLATLAAAIGPEMERTALILVGPALGAEGFDESRLYAGDYDRRYRPVGTDPRFPE